MKIDGLTAGHTVNGKSCVRSGEWSLLYDDEWSFCIWCFVGKVLSISPVAGWVNKIQDSKVQFDTREVSVFRLCKIVLSPRV